MSKYLDLGTAIFALLASFFWFASASGSMPLIITNWGSTPEADPYRLALITAPKWIPSRPSSVVYPRYAHPQVGRPLGRSGHGLNQPLLLEGDPELIPTWSSAVSSLAEVASKRSLARCQCGFADMQLRQRHDERASVGLQGLVAGVGVRGAAPLFVPGCLLTTINPSRIACLRASLRTRRTASALSRTVRSDGFS
jgi:hypothetical protein